MAPKCTCQVSPPPYFAIDSHPPIASSSLPQHSPVLVCPPPSPSPHQLSSAHIKASTPPVELSNAHVRPPPHPTSPLTAIPLLPLLPSLSTRLCLCVLSSPPHKAALRCTYQPSTPPPHPSIDSHPPVAYSSLPQQSPVLVCHPLSPSRPVFRCIYQAYTPPLTATPFCLFFLPHPDYTTAIKALAFFLCPSLPPDQFAGLHPSIHSQPPAAKAAGAGAPGEMWCSVVQHGALAGFVIVKSTQQLIIQQLHGHRLVLVVLQVERGGAELELASDGIYDAWKASDPVAPTKIVAVAASAAGVEPVAPTKIAAVAASAAGVEPVAPTKIAAVAASAAGVEPVAPTQIAAAAAFGGQRRCKSGRRSGGGGGGGDAGTSGGSGDGGGSEFGGTAK
ncbi:unnamed protein product [Closterium sp. NIES-64]|nr:unnamed protein product [Closterium sp. NIES-64]